MPKALLIGLLLAGTSLVPFAAAGAQEADPVPASEPEPGAAGARVFPPTYFTQYAPQTALDMVRRVPGFQIDQGENRRGLGQGGANVLLNGERFSAKSTDIFTALGRIGAASVTRIELLDAASLDIPGLSGQVANVIYEAGGGAGQFRYSPQVRTRGTDPVLYNGEISYSGKLGKVEYTLGFANGSYRQGNDGPELVSDGDGALIDRREEFLRIEGEQPKLSAALKHRDDAGNIANLNLAFERPRRTERELSFTPQRTRRFFTTEQEYNYEISGDYEFALGRGRLKLIGLNRFEHSPFRNDLRTDYVDGRPAAGTLQDLFIDEGETIARAEYRWKGGSNDWQVSLEGALNDLDTDTLLSELQPDGSFAPIDLPGAAATIREQRGEADLSWGRPLTSKLTIQTSLGAEYSRLSQSGARGLVRQFVRSKGFVSLAWKPLPTLDVRFRAERSVGQLNFFDFAAQTDLGSGNQDAGNPDLVPQQSWDFELEATKTLGPWGSATLTADYRRISDLVAQVPIGAFGEAPGNVDLAIVYGLKATGTLKFEPLGWTGAQLEFSGRYRHARLDDPLTGARIPVSNNLKYDIDLNLRQDIPESDWAYGAGYFKFAEEPGFRLNQISQFTFANGDAYLYVENKDVLGLKVRLTAGNLLDTGENFRRILFVNRRDGPIAFDEARERTAGKVLTLDISGTF